MHTYKVGDYVKVEFSDESTGIGEWMWVRVSRRNEAEAACVRHARRLPLNDYDGKIGAGSELAVSYSQIREHRKPMEFTKQ